jgi:anthranilate synthase component 1
VIDNLSGKLYLIVYADPASPRPSPMPRSDCASSKPSSSTRSVPRSSSSQTLAERDFAKADYLAAVERAKELIAAGDFMQVQVGQRIKKRYTESPAEPVPCAAFAQPVALHVLLQPLDGGAATSTWWGQSPEILVRQEQVEHAARLAQKITIRPLAGTRPRAASPEQDQAWSMN